VLMFRVGGALPLLPLYALMAWTRILPNIAGELTVFIIMVSSRMCVVINPIT